MKKISLTLVLSAIICSFSMAQERDIKAPLQKGEMNRVLNTAFSRLATSNSNPGEIANYATLDLVNASFLLKGSFPVQRSEKKRFGSLSREDQLGKDPARVSYLSFSIAGTLLDKKYGALFSDSRLNAGVSLQSQYNFTVKRPSFSFFNEDWNDFATKKELLLKKHNDGKIDLEKKMNIVSLDKNRYLLQLKQVASKVKLGKNQTALNLAQKTIDSLGTAVVKRPGLIDTLQTLSKDNMALQQEIVSTDRSIDSLNIVEISLTGDKLLIIEGMRKKLKTDYDTLLAKVTLQKIKITWFTILGGYTRKSYSTFNPALLFSTQIGKGKLNAWNAGIAINRLYQNKLTGHTIFLNASVSRLRDNNLSSLSTTAIDQTRTIVNSGGDTTRTIINKFTVYTSPVTAFNAWNISAHGYFLFGKKNPSGFHIFPSVNFKKNKDRFSSLTAGYLIGFKNSIKDQPVVNTEFYVRFNDLFDKGETGKQFYKRNEIGVSFSVPFNIF